MFYEDEEVPDCSDSHYNGGCLSNEPRCCFYLSFTHIMSGDVVDEISIINRSYCFVYVAETLEIP